MRDRRLDRLFLRFRTRGDVQALGAVFDRTAGELLRVAMSLVRDPGAADDLLQQTYLTAIERRESWDASRSLTPWLLGILVRHAREERRRRARAPGPDDLERGAPRTPEETALDREVAHELRAALGRLPEGERAVLEPWLLEERGAAEIARASGLTPGAVRMRIHRGLERLRRVLPAGLAAGGAAGVAHGRGLAAVRAAVLASGEGAAAVMAPVTAGAAGTGILGGVLMSKKIVLVLGLVVLAVSVAVLRGGLGTERGRAPAAESTVAAREPDAPPARTLEVPEVPAAVVGVRAEAQPSTERAPAAVTRDPALGGVRGRLVESDGTPVPGVAVTLLEADDLRLGGRADLDPGAGPELVVAEAVTAEDGTFVLDGAATRAVHGLGIDLGGQRSGLRILGAVLEPGAFTDLGDVALAPTSRLRGTVVDEDGEPVAGARVRAGPVSPFLVGLGMHQLQAGGAIAEMRPDRDPDHVFEVPRWIARYEDRLPLATTRTDAEGRFDLGHVPAGRTVVVVDVRDLPRVHVGPFELPEGVDRELDEVELLPGASLEVRVVDDEGRPVPGAEVRPGVLVPGMRVAVLGAIVRADEDGVVRAEHLPEDLQACALARRDATSQWAVAEHERGGLVVRLAAESELLVEVVLPDGTPVGGVAVELRPGSRDAVPWLADPPVACEATPVEGVPGRWSLGPCTHGSYWVTARVEGLGLVRKWIRHPADSGVERLVLAPIAALAVRVRGIDGSPLSGAAVRLERREASPAETYSLARTGADGAATLHAPRGEPVVLRVEHRGHAPYATTLPQDHGEEVEVSLGVGGRLVARAADPTLGDSPCMLVLEAGGEHGASLPRLLALPPDGPLVVEHLAPGKWRWTLLDSLSTREALDYLDPSRLPGVQGRGTFELVEGETHELALGAVQVDGSAPEAGVVQGRLRVAGREPDDLRVDLLALDEEAETRQEFCAGGRFRLEGVRPGNYYLSVSRVPYGGGGGTVLLQEQVLVEAGQEYDFERDVELNAVSLRVLTADGAAAQGARVHLVPEEPGLARATSETDGRGVAELDVVGSGAFRVVASHPLEGFGLAEIEVGQGPSDVTVRLERGVDCAGELRLELAGPPERPEATLFLHSTDDSLISNACPVRIENGHALFQAAGLRPGSYRAILFIDGGTHVGAFELPEWGSTSLELELEKQDQQVVLRTSED